MAQVKSGRVRNLESIRGKTKASAKAAGKLLNAAAVHEANDLKDFNLENIARQIVAQQLKKAGASQFPDYTPLGYSAPAYVKAVKSWVKRIKNNKKHTQGSLRAIHEALFYDALTLIQASGMQFEHVAPLLMRLAYELCGARLKYGLLGGFNITLASGVGSALKAPLAVHPELAKGMQAIIIGMYLGHRLLEVDQAIYCIMLTVDELRDIWQQARIMAAYKKGVGEIVNIAGLGQ